MFEGKGKFGVSVRRLVLAMLFCLYSTQLIFAQAEIPTPLPNSTCSDLTFTSEALQGFNPALIKVNNSIVSTNPALGIDSGDRIIGRFLASNFYVPLCFLTRLESGRKAAVCTTKDRVVVQVNIGGRKLKVEGKRESYMFAVIGPNFVADNSPFIDGVAYYFRKGVIRSIDVKKWNGAYRVRLKRVGSYVGSCDDRVR